MASRHAGQGQPVVDIPSTDRSAELTIIVRRNRGLAQRRAELDDFAGTMTRLREAYDALNQTWPIGWSPDLLVDAMQTGDRLSYHPELAAEQIARLHTILPKLPSSIEELERNSTEQERKELAERLKTEFKAKTAKQIGADYKKKLMRAKAAIADVVNSN